MSPAAGSGAGCRMQPTGAGGCSVAGNGPQLSAEQPLEGNGDRLSPCATAAGRGRRALWKLRDGVTSQRGLKAVHLSIHPSLPAPDPVPLSGAASDSHRDMALGLRAPAHSRQEGVPLGCHGSVLLSPSAVFLQDFSCFSSLFLTSAPGSPKPVGKHPCFTLSPCPSCLTPFYEQGVAAPIIAPAQSCFILLIVHPDCPQHPL